MHSHIATYTTARLFLHRQYVYQHSHDIIVLGENKSYRIRQPLPNDPLYINPLLIQVKEPAWCSDIRTQLARSGSIVTALVSDASDKKDPAPCSSVFDPDTSNHTVQACVVISSTRFAPFLRPPAAYVQIIGIPKEARAYDGELMGAVCLLTLRRFIDSPPNTIQAGLDCKSVIQNTGIGVPQIQRRTLRVEPDEQLELNCRHLHVTTQPRIVHIPAHLDEPQYNRHGQLKRRPIPRGEWDHMSLLQEVADILADPSPSTQQLALLERLNHLPSFLFTVKATDLVEGAMTPGFWWWRGRNPNATLLCSRPDLYHYLRQRQQRTTHGIPWADARLGLLTAMLHKHSLWKFKRLRTMLMRYLWDYLPHGRTFAKQEGANIPVCPLCHLDADDLHHLLVECSYPSIASLRRTYLNKSLQSLRSSSRVPQLVIDYARTLTRLLTIPDPSRLSHAIWLGRPFLSTLLAADDLMPRDHYQGAILSQLAYHLPSFLLALFEGVIELWKTRCKLIHPPDPLPLVRIPRASLKKL